MRKISKRVAALVALLVAATWVFSILIPSDTASASTASPLSIRILLRQTRVTAGQTITGFAAINNKSSKPITVEACALDGWIYVGLTNKTITYDPAVATVACEPTVQLHPGVNGFPIEVLTIFLHCGGKPVTLNDPPCGRNGIPPLPAGHYTTKVITFGLPARTPAPAPIAVTLVAPKH